MIGLTAPSPGSSYMVSPVNSRPPSRHQTSLPPPPPIWPPSGNMNSLSTGSVSVNSPANLKQPTPPPSVCSSMSPAPIRSPASIHVPTPTSFHIPHPYPPHGTSSLTSPAQSPVPPQSPSNINQLMRSSTAGTATPMPSSHPSPVPQSHHTILPSGHHLTSQVVS